VARGFADVVDIAGAEAFLAGDGALGGVIKASQPGLWLILLQPVAFMTYLLSAIAETNRTPFDMPEAEGELVSGLAQELKSPLQGVIGNTEVMLASGGLGAGYLLALERVRTRLLGTPA